MKTKYTGKRYFVSTFTSNESLKKAIHCWAYNKRYYFRDGIMYRDCFECIKCNEADRVFSPYDYCTKDDLEKWPGKEEGELTFKEYNTLEEMMLDHTELFL